MRRVINDHTKLAADTVYRNRLQKVKGALHSLRHAWPNPTPRRDLFRERYSYRHNIVLDRLISGGYVERVGNGKLTEYKATDTLMDLDREGMLELVYDITPQVKDAAVARDDTPPESARSGPTDEDPEQDDEDPEQDDEVTHDELLKSIVVWCNHLGEQLDEVRRELAQVHAIVKEFVE